MRKLRNFWRQPASGIGEGLKGRSLEELLDWEHSTGKILPTLLRKHLQMQNGGQPRFSGYYDPKSSEGIPLFMNGETICALQDITKTLRFVLEGFMDADDIDKLVIEQRLRLDRLHLLSYQDGHTCICLDYGYKEEKMLENPRVVAFEMDYPLLRETFYVDSYEGFINNLHYTGSDIEYHIGVESALPLDALANYFGEKLNCIFDKDNSDYYGWFDFDEWYEYGTYTDRGYRFFVLSPNQHRSGTFLFQDDDNIPYIFTVRYNDFDKLDIISKIVEEWIDLLNSKQVRCCLLLAPTMDGSLCLYE